LLIGELLCFGLADLPLVFQIAFVADKDDGHFLVSVVPHFLQPLPNRLKRVPPRDVVHKKDPDGLPVVGIRDGSVSLLPCGVPDLGTNEDVLNGNVMSGEFDSDGSVRVTLKLVLRVSQQ